MLIHTRSFILFILSFNLLFSACKKSGPQADPEPVPGSQKNILSFTLLKADNTSDLQADIIGTIKNDTIFLVVPAETNITALKPAITFNGASVSPNSGVIQNFSSPLDYIVTGTDGSTKKYVVVMNYRSTIFTSSLLGSLRAFDGSTGQLIWELNNQQFSSGTPSVYKGNVYCYGWDGFYAVDARTGVQKWKFPLATVTNTGNANFFNSPVVANDVAYLAAFDGYVYALNTIDGSLKWKTKSIAGKPFVSSVTLNNNLLYSGCEDNLLYALDITSGNIVWTANTEMPSYVNPLVVNGNVYVQGWSKSWYMLNGTTGAVIWTREGFDNMSSPTYRDGIIYEGGGNTATAVNAATGTLLWLIHLSPDGLSYNERSSPVIDGGKFYSASGDGTFYVYDATTRDLVWKFSTGSGATINSSPVLSDGIIYTSNNNGTLWGLKAKDGSVAFEVGIGNGFLASPVAVDKNGVKHYPGISGEQQ
jgi:eukaryotic-like serine/threonine-protein kinase